MKARGAKRIVEEGRNGDGEMSRSICCLVLGAIRVTGEAALRLWVVMSSLSYIICSSADENLGYRGSPQARGDIRLQSRPRARRGSATSC